MWMQRHFHSKAGADCCFRTLHKKKQAAAATHSRGHMVLRGHMREGSSYTRDTWRDGRIRQGGGTRRLPSVEYTTPSCALSRENSLVFVGSSPPTLPSCRAEPKGVSAPVGAVDQFTRQNGLHEGTRRITIAAPCHPVPEHVPQGPRSFLGDRFWTDS